MNDDRTKDARQQLDCSFYCVLLFQTTQIGRGWQLLGHLRKVVGHALDHGFADVRDSGHHISQRACHTADCLVHFGDGILDGLEEGFKLVDYVWGYYRKVK